MIQRETQSFKMNAVSRLTEIKCMYNVVRGKISSFFYFYFLVLLQVIGTDTT